MRTEQQIKEMLSIDIYNIMLEKENDGEFRTMAKVLKDREETQLLYSILVNR